MTGFGNAGLRLTNKKRGSNFLPSSLFGAGDNGSLFDFNAASVLKLASDGSGANCGLGDPIGYASDLSGKNNHANQITGANKPLLKKDANGCFYAEFDGVNDVLNFAGFNSSVSSLIIIGFIRSINSAKCAISVTGQILYLDAGTNKWGTFNNTPVLSSYNATINKYLALISRAPYDVDLYTNEIKENNILGITYNGRGALGTIGAEQSGVQFADMNLYAVLAINKVLTVNEITAVYNYYRGRLS